MTALGRLTERCEKLTLEIFGTGAAVSIDETLVAEPRPGYWARAWNATGACVECGWGHTRTGAAIELRTQLERRTLARIRERR
jgi:hypothetical protein